MKDPASETTSADAASSRARAAVPVGDSGSPPDRTLVHADEELRRATALALAIQNNPNMTKEEILQFQQQGKHHEELPKNNLDFGSLASFNMSKKVRPFRFDGSRFTAFRSAVTGQLTMRDSSSHGEQQHDDLAAEHGLREKSKRNLLDAHRAKKPVQRDQVKENSSVRGGGPVSVDMDISSSIRTNINTAITSTAAIGRLMRSNKSRTPPLSPRRAPTDVPGLADSYVNMTSRLTSTAMLQNLQSVMNHNRQRPMSKAPIRLTGIAWKRRGGMGKYATTGGWERRRIELQGTRILYYAKDETDDVHDDDEDGENGLSNSLSLEDAASPNFKRDSAPGEDVGEGVVVAKQSNWFEYAFSQQHEDPNTPRGFLDLAKEKASVHASLAHGGAPTPFAVSIKVRGETKWKFCFDHHREQMEWLAALTDVVVQNSVDGFNATLLEGADPTSNDTLSMLTNTISAPIKAPPPAPDNGAGIRLWQVQPYTISSQATRDVDYEDDDDGVDELELCEHEDEDLLTDLPTEEDHKKRQMFATEEAKRKWVAPSENLLYVAIVLNAAAAVARLSTLSVEGFWFLLVLANASLYCCLKQEPDWKSVVTFVRASPQEKKNGIAETKVKDKISSNKLDTVAASKVKNAPEFKPIAGTTTVKLKNPTDLPVNDKNELFAGWRAPPGDSLLVRSHGYMTTKKKIPSPGELYELVQCDIFEAPIRYPDMATRVKLPALSFPDDEGREVKTWRAPDMFVITIALPTDPPKLTRTSGDGGGYTITMYFAMKQETRDILRRVTGDGYDPSNEEYGDDMQKTKVNAVRLLEEWVRRAPSDEKWFSRFKCVPNAHNLREIGMPSWISQYNGKPFLIKRPGVTGFIYQHPELSVFEFDISLHPFPYLARQGLCFLKENFFKKVLVSFGFVIEGRTDDELPECIIGCLQLCYPNPAHAIQAKDFFSGTSARSF